MPITSNSKSIEFGYEFETPSGLKVIYAMKYYQSENGPVVLIGDGENGIAEFPAAMFQEVSEYLTSQGVGSSYPLPVKKPTKPFGLPSIPKLPKIDNVVAPTDVEAEDGDGEIEPIQSVTAPVVSPQEAKKFAQERAAAKGKATDVAKIKKKNGE